jgi:TPP-dependent pyruvate/acetoin dehydrogenase alpha subunit
VVYETLNIAALWRLPLLLVCEDNHWAQSTPRAVNTAGSMRARFEAFGLPVTEMDTTDVEAISRSAQAQIAAIRRGDGPRVLLLHTYRLCHHSKSDDARPEADIAERWLVEPLVVQGRRLSIADRTRIDGEVETAVAALASQARALP